MRSSGERTHQRDFALELADTEERELPDAWRIPVPADDSDAEIAARIREALIEVGPLPIPPASPAPTSI